MALRKVGICAIDLLAVAAGLVIAVPFLLIVSAPFVFGY